MINLGYDGLIGCWDFQKLFVVFIVLRNLCLKVDNFRRLELILLNDYVVGVCSGVELLRASITCGFTETISHPEQVFAWHRFTSI